MAGKRSHEIDSPENVGNTSELSHDEEDKLLGDDDAEINQPPRTLQNNPTTRWEQHF